MTLVVMRNIRKYFGESRALTDFSLTVNSGELVCLLGPSGCGKTTALRILAGFEKADAGTIEVDSESIGSVPVEKRNFGMVFQDYSLFPNMTARQNIEFGLKAQKVSATQRRTTIDRMLHITDLEDQTDKFPHQMSGGQKQRVALARAIATSPRVLLLDEPLSALDAKVRESLREEIRHLQREVGVTTVFVTHDQQEALAIADRVGVMSNGQLEQIATPRELYQNPQNSFVAKFIGSINRIPATSRTDGLWNVLDAILTGSRAGTELENADAGIRPEDITVSAAHQESANAIVADSSFLGPITRVKLTLNGVTTVYADLMSVNATPFISGQPVLVGVRSELENTIIF